MKLKIAGAAVVLLSGAFISLTPGTVFAQSMEK
jgi:hypothetical protein